MGTYTEHWEQHKQFQRKGLVRILLLLIGAFAVQGLTAYLLNVFDVYSLDWLHAVIMVVWLIIIIPAIIRYSRVTCPRCQNVFVQGKGVSACDKCGLRILQEEP